jgi:hypothetical protein
VVAVFDAVVGVVAALNRRLHLSPVRRVSETCVLG